MFLVLITAPTYAAKTLKIGIVDCYSGPAATYTNDVRDAFKMEVDKLNASGGILGRISGKVGTHRTSGLPIDTNWRLQLDSEL